MKSEDFLKKCKVRDTQLNSNSFATVDSRSFETCAQSETVYRFDINRVCVAALSEPKYKANKTSLHTSVYTQLVEVGLV